MSTFDEIAALLAGVAILAQLINWAEGKLFFVPPGVERFRDKVYNPDGRVTYPESVVYRLGSKNDKGDA